MYKVEEKKIPAGLSYLAMWDIPFKVSRHKSKTGQLIETRNPHTEYLFKVASDYVKADLRDNPVKSQPLNQSVWATTKDVADTLKQKFDTLPDYLIGYCEERRTKAGLGKNAERIEFYERKIAFLKKTNCLAKFAIVAVK